MNNTQTNWMNMALAPTGGLIGAVIGGLLWAKYVQWTGLTAGWVALAIGIFTGVGVLLTSKSRAIPVSVIAALFAIIGILMGKYFDVRWNAVERLKVQLINEHQLEPEQAEPMAKTIIAGQSTWELMRGQMQWFDLVFYTIAGFLAFRVSYSRRLYRYFFKT